MSRNGLKQCSISTSGFSCSPVLCGGSKARPASCPTLTEGTAPGQGCVSSRSDINQKSAISVSGKRIKEAPTGDATDRLVPLLYHLSQYPFNPPNSPPP